MALYKKAGVNPMGGCLPMLFQFPVLIAMFFFFQSSAELPDEVPGGPFLFIMVEFVEYRLYLFFKDSPVAFQGDEYVAKSVDSLLM